MVFIKPSDVSKGLTVYKPAMPPRRFMLQMYKKFGKAYWVSGVTLWLIRGVKIELVDLQRYLIVQKKIRSLGYAVDEAVHGRFDIIEGQISKEWNNAYKIQTDLRHARFIDVDLSDWDKEEVKLAKVGAKLFLKSGEKDLTRFCRLPNSKRKGFREIQLLVEFYLNGEA